jgi:hypothetical protein
MIKRDKIVENYNKLLMLEVLEKMEYWIDQKVNKNHPAPMEIEIHGAWVNEGRFWPSPATYKAILNDIISQKVQLEDELSGSKNI